MRVFSRIHRGFFSRLMYRIGWRGYCIPLRAIHIGYWCDTDAREMALKCAIDSHETFRLRGSWMLACAVGDVAHEGSHADDADAMGARCWWRVKLWELVTGGFRKGAMEAKAYAIGRHARDMVWNGVRDEH